MFLLTFDDCSVNSYGMNTATQTMRRPPDAAEIATRQEADRPAFARSRVSNGSALLPGVDGRSAWVRRARDLIEDHEQDLGGADHLSTAERSLVRRCAVLTVELERLEQGFAQAPPSAEALDLYQRTAGNLRRLLESLGLQRRTRDVVPDLKDYLRARSSSA